MSSWDSCVFCVHNYNVPYILELQRLYILTFKFLAIKYVPQCTASDSGSAVRDILGTDILIAVCIKTGLPGCDAM
jgi:hypothetical protein